MTTRSAVRRSVLLLLCGCLPEKSSSLYCGEGTHEEDGGCVADAPADDDTGEPTGDDGGGEGGSEGGSEGGTDSGAEGGGTDGGSDGGGEAGGGDEGGGEGGEGGEGGGDYDVCASGGAPYTEIQDAVDAASDGDTITVCAGIYDRVELDRVELTLVGEDAASTFIVGASTAAILGNDCTVTLSGFTLQGYPDTTRSTSGIYMENSTVTLSELTFEGNNDGGYLTIFRDSDVTITDVSAVNNHIASFVASTGSGSLLLRHSIAHDNAAYGGNGLVLVYVDREVNAEISNNLFYDIRESENMFYTIELMATENAWVYNNVFDELPGYCAVMVGGDGVNFQNNIVTKGVGHTLCQGAEGMGEVTYNLIDDYDSDFSFEIDATNIDGDPAFNDPGAGDYTLDPGFSIAVDAGNPLSGYNDPDGTRNDLGAYGGPYGSW